MRIYWTNASAIFSTILVIAMSISGCGSQAPPPGVPNPADETSGGGAVLPQSQAPSTSSLEMEERLIGVEQEMDVFINSLKAVKGTVSERGIADSACLNSAVRQGELQALTIKGYRVGDTRQSKREDYIPS
jgi:hypothetical protein